MAGTRSNWRWLVAPSTALALALAAILALGDGPFVRSAKPDEGERRATAASPAERRRAHADRRALVVAAVAAYGLVLALGLAVRSRRRRLCYPAYLGLWWLAVEAWAAPYWVVQLGLVNYWIIRDVDHRPTDVGKEYNSDALRGTREPKAFTRSSCNVLFLGDSFTFGLRVGAHQAFPALFERELAARHPAATVRVANFGWTSSSPLLSYRRLVDHGDRYHPDLVVLCVDMTDFMDDIRWQGMLDRRGIYWLYDKLPLTVQLFEKLARGLFERTVAWSTGAPSVHRFYGVRAPLEETAGHFEPLVANVARIHQWCAARGADFVLVILPRSFQFSARECPRNWEAGEYEVLGPWCLEPFRYFDELRPRVPYPVLSLLEDFRSSDEFPLCFEDDPHWNPAGHALAAAALVRELEPRLGACLGAR